MRIVFGMVAIVLAAATAQAEDLQLEAGVARADITPASFMTMYGYANRKCGPANGTHDPLYAKALVLATGESRMAIVTLDLGNIASESLGPKVASALGIRYQVLPIEQPFGAMLTTLEETFRDQQPDATPARIDSGLASRSTCGPPSERKPPFVAITTSSRRKPSSALARSRSDAPNP